MRRRRQFHTRSRHVVDFTDEVLGALTAQNTTPTAIPPCSQQSMHPAVRECGTSWRPSRPNRTTSSDSNTRVLVIEGGPGTGKTVVALHRVAYLLYTQRERMERHGVLVVGPNPAFLNHIGRVLPSLGESDVVFMTTGDLVPGLRVTAEDAPEAAGSKAR